MNRRQLLQSLLGGAALAAAPSTALALPRQTQLAATGPAIARVYCRFGWVTPVQHKLAVALRRWEAELGRPATWEDARVDECGKDAKSLFHRAQYHVAVECATAVKDMLLSRGWETIRAGGQIPEAVLHPAMMPWDNHERIDVASFVYEEHWLHPTFTGTVQDVLIPLYGVAGMVSASVSLGRMGWSDGEF